MSADRRQEEHGTSSFHSVKTNQLIQYRIYDGDPHPLPLSPGKLPPDTDPPLSIPSDLPKTTSPNLQERFHKTPIYDSLT
jgi:hypothetical protein